VSPKLWPRPSLEPTWEAKDGPGVVVLRVAGVVIWHRGLPLPDRRSEPPGPLFSTLSGDPISAQYVRAMMRRAADHAGIERRVHPHGLRHAHAAELVLQQRVVISGPPGVMRLAGAGLAVASPV
jgi:integrase